MSGETRGENGIDMEHETEDGTDLDTSSEAADSESPDVLRFLVPASLAVVTWLVVLLAAGYVFRLNSVTFFTVIPLLLIGALFWPVLAVVPWKEGLSTRTVFWAKRNREKLFAIILLVLVAVFPFTPRLLVRVIELPYRGSGIFFGASLFYRERLGATFAELLLRFGQWYLELLWLYLLATALVAVVGWVR